MVEPPWGHLVLSLPPSLGPSPGPGPALHRKLNCNSNEDSTQLGVPLALLVDPPWVHLVLSLCPGTSPGTETRNFTLLMTLLSLGYRGSTLDTTGLVDPLYSRVDTES